MNNIYSLVQEARKSYSTDEIEVVEGYDFSQFETLKLVDLMMNSRFLSGQQDGLGRDKPFKNIVKFRRNVAVRATDMDTKDIQLKAKRKKDQWVSFALTLKLKEWMKRTGFAKTMNKPNEYRATYGTGVVKKTRKDGKMYIETVPWSSLITDQIDFFAAPIIERHFMSPQQLRAKVAVGWYEEQIEDLIRSAQENKRKRTQAADESIDDNETLGVFIEVNEVHGEFPETEINENGDENKYSKQMHIVAMVGSDDKETDNYTLYKGIESELPYKVVHWDTQDGRALGVGVVEDLFEHQIWTNYLIKQEKDLIDLSSTLIFKRAVGSDGDATNILTDVMMGEILDDDIVPVNNAPTSFPALQSLITDWDNAASRQTSSFEAKTGELKPSNATFRGTALLNAEADGYYQYKMEGYALFLKEVLRDWIIPELFRELEDDLEFAADLEPHELQKIDTAYARKLANEKYMNEIMKGNFITQEQYEGMIALEMQTLKESGIRRFLKHPTDFVSDPSAYEIDIIISGESENKAATFENLSSILNAVISAQQPDGSNALLDNPRLSAIFEQIIETAGVISPIEMPTATPVQPQLGAVQLQGINS